MKAKVMEVKNAIVDWKYDKLHLGSYVKYWYVKVRIGNRWFTSSTPYPNEKSAKAAVKRILKQ